MQKFFSAKNTVSAAILGDLNSDGIVNADDVNVLQNYLIKKSGELSDISLDLNNDNTVNVFDLIKLKKNSNQHISIRCELYSSQ